MFAYFHPATSWAELARRTARETVNDGCFGLAAQLAFYFLLALFPALLVVASVLAHLPIHDALGQVLSRFDILAPQQAADLVARELQRIRAGDNTGLVTVAIAGAIWSSSSAVTAIIDTLNRAYDVEEWRPWWIRRGIAILLTLALATFVVGAVLLVVTGPRVGAWIAEQVGLGAWVSPVWQVAQWPLAFALIVFVVDLVYYFAPNADTEWVWITPGSLLATALWLLVSLGFRLYVSAFGNFAAVYGAIGSVIVLLLWLYASGLAVLIGAELNSEIDHAEPGRDDAPQGPQHRKRIGPRR